MNQYLFYFAPSWTDRMAWTLLHFLWQGAVIAGVFAAARFLLAASLGARARYGLACLALALMALAPVVTFVSLRPAAARVAVHALEAPASPAAPEPAPSSTAIPIERLLPWTVALWITGAFACSLRLAGGWFVTASLRFAGAVQPAPPEWQSRLDALARRIGATRGVRLLVSSLAQTPMAVGHLRPVVLVPLGALAGLPADQLEALVAHELAHIWRGDYLANLLQSVVEALLFYHPAVWWVSKQIRVERELCCDDLAVSLTGDRVVYARALTAIEALRPVHAQAALAAAGGDLLGRIRRLVEPAGLKPRSGFAPTVALSVLVFIGAAAATAVPVIPARVSAVVAFTPRPVLQPSLAQPAIPAAPPKSSAHRARRPAGEPRGSVPANPDPEMAAAASLDLIQREPEPAVNRELEHREPNREPRLPEGGWTFRRLFEPPYEGRVLTAIDIRGFSEPAGSELASRLPLRVGDRISSNSLELVGRVAREYEGARRIEYRFGAEGENQTVLYIHPAGLAGAAPNERK
jgi:beta-lactamase regulating signal transducer with metallopeptidase domain